MVVDVVIRSWEVEINYETPNHFTRATLTMLQTFTSILKILPMLVNIFLAEHELARIDGGTT